MAKKIRTLFLFCFVIVLIITCKKNNIDATTATDQPSGEQVDLSAKVTASVSGFVTNESNMQVEGANVQYGASTTSTDKYGYFEIKNATVTQQAAFVTVNMNGYFRGIKTFIAQEGKENFCRIKLIPKTNSGTINAVNGGDVILSNGLNISIPANGIMDATTNAAYTGTVHVASFWIDPTGDDLESLMPGDLRGINEDNFMRALTTYGMAAVELTGDAGELLQVAEGKKANLTMPIPAALLANAPSTIPLWYFDESIGLWKEEGLATKSGNNYSGDVAHFSFWNCDVPSIMSFLDFTIVDQHNTPVIGVRIKISDVNNPATYRYAYTNTSGYASGAVPKDRQLILEVMDGDCSVFSFSFSSEGKNNIHLGNIALSQTNIATLSGTLVNCNNAPVTNGRIIIKHANKYSTGPLSNNGTFSFNQVLCGDTTSSLFIAEDMDALKQSFPIFLALVPGNNSHNFQACDVPTLEFINYTIDGTPYSYSPPFAEIYARNYNLQFLGLAGNPTNNTSSVYIDILDPIPGIAGTRSLYGFSPPQPQVHGSAQVNPVTVYFTEYGQPGEFVAGYFDGDFYNPNSGAHHVVCSFRSRVSP